MLNIRTTVTNTTPIDLSSYCHLSFLRCSVDSMSPPLGGKSKPKIRDGRRSRSRNTTPFPIVSIPIGISAPSSTAYLEISIANLSDSTTINYNNILEQHSGGGGIPDPRDLENMANDLKTLSIFADTKCNACDGAMRELSKRRKEKLEDNREREKMKRDAEEKDSLKRVAEDEEEARGRKGGKLKKIKKEGGILKEERPLSHGAHGLARQDGLDLPVKGMFLKWSSFVTISSLLRHSVCY